VSRELPDRRRGARFPAKENGRALGKSAKFAKKALTSQHWTIIGWAGRDHQVQRRDQLAFRGSEKRKCTAGKGENVFFPTGKERGNEKVRDRQAPSLKKKEY